MNKEELFRIVVSVSEEDLLSFEIDSKKYFSILEVRLDLCSQSFIQNKLISILKEIDSGILFTYRLPEDSSLDSKSILMKKDISELLKEFNNSNNFLDLDLKYESSIFDDFQNSQYSLIYSYHNFQRILTEEELSSFLRKGNSVDHSEKVFYKFAVMANSLEEAESFMQLFQKYSGEYKMIGIVMGEFGVYSRVFGDFYGSRFTYCTLTDPKAPGQVKAEDLIKFRARTNLGKEKESGVYRRLSLDL